MRGRLARLGSECHWRIHEARAQERPAPKIGTTRNVTGRFSHLRCCIFDVGQVGTLRPLSIGLCRADFSVNGPGGRQNGRKPVWGSLPGCAPVANRVANRRSCSGSITYGVVSGACAAFQPGVAATEVAARTLKRAPQCPRLVVDTSLIPRGVRITAKPSARQLVAQLPLAQQRADLARRMLVQKVAIYPKLVTAPRTFDGESRLRRGRQSDRGHRVTGELLFQITLDEL